LRYQRNLYTAEKYTVGYNSVADNAGLSSFVYLLLPPKYKKCGEIPIEFDLTAVQGHPRSSILVSMESPYVTSYSSLIVSLAVSATIFEIFTLEDRKLLISPTPPLFDAPARENPIEFLDETYPAKTGGMGLLYVENCRDLRYWRLKGRKSPILPTVTLKPGSGVTQGH